MPTFNLSAVADAAIAFQKPITLQQGRAFRDNLLAALLADASVPDVYLPTVDLGTFNLSTGVGSVAVAGLDLTPYKQLAFSFNNVNPVVNDDPVYIGTAPIFSRPSASGGAYGVIMLDLANGVVSGGGLQTGIAATNLLKIYGGASGYSTATTTITVSASASGFNTSTVLMYGVK